MSIAKKMFKALPDTTLRRIRNTPSYLFLIWRWGTWLYALIVILGSDQSYKNSPVYNTCLYLLLITLFQTLIVTLYAPMFQAFLPRTSRQRTERSLQQRRQRAPAEDTEPEVTPPLVRTL